MEVDHNEIRELAGRLVGQLPAGSNERAWAVLLHGGKVPKATVELHFRRICIHVRNSKSTRISKPNRQACVNWLATHGARVDQVEVRGARRLEMRLTVEEYDTIKKAADRAGFKMASYVRWVTMLAAEKEIS